MYVAWAPFAARSVTAPLRMIQRHTPGVGAYEDVYLDKRTTQFESAAVATTLVVLIGAVTAPRPSERLAAIRRGAAPPVDPLVAGPGDASGPTR